MFSISVISALQLVLAPRARRPKEGTSDFPAAGGLLFSSLVFLFLFSVFFFFLTSNEQPRARGRPPVQLKKKTKTFLFRSTTEKYSPAGDLPVRPDGVLVVVVVPMTAPTFFFFFHCRLTILASW